MQLSHACLAVVVVQVAVFGFCDIRRFTDTTEVLQEGVMEFVNTIAHLVHGAVSARGGAANKNIGDAFLLVRQAQPLDLLFQLVCNLWSVKDMMSTWDHIAYSSGRFMDIAQPQLTLCCVLLLLLLHVGTGVEASQGS